MLKKILQLNCALIIFHIHHLTKVLSFDLHSYQGLLNSILIKFPSDNNKKFITFDLFSSNTWLYTTNTSPEVNPTLLPLNYSLILMNKEYTIKAQPVHNEIILITSTHNQSINFSYLQSFTQIKGIEGSISLSYKFNNTENSIIYQLYHNNLITKASFAFVRDSLPKQLYFGGLPLNYTKGRTHSYCDVIQENTHWNCIINRISINGIRGLMVYNNSPMIFAIDTTEWYLNVPSDYMDFILDVYFKNISRSRCYLQEARPKRVLICDCIPSLKDDTITFEIGDYSYTLNMTDLWFCFEQLCNFAICENPYGNEFRLGLQFHQQFNIEFDYDRHQMDFYSFSNIISYTKSHNRLMKLLFIINIVLLFIGLLMTILKYKK